MRKKIGIDIGSVNIRIASNEKGEQTPMVEPSVVAVNIDDSREVLACGKDAVRLANRVTGGVKLVYPFAEKLVFSPLYTGKLLAHLTRISGCRHCDAYVSLSHKLEQNNEKILVDALQEAGVCDVSMIEPTFAAGCGCGVPGMGDNTIIDIGACFSNIASYSNSKNVMNTDSGFGGEAINKAISVGIFHKYRYSVTPSVAEKIKLEHASLTRFSTERFSVPVTKPTLGLPSTLVLKENDISEFIENVTDTFFDSVINGIRGLNIEPEKIVLTGGGAQLDGLAQALQGIIHYPVVVANDPANAIIRGLIQIINSDIKGKEED